MTSQGDHRICPRDGTALVGEPITYGGSAVVTVDRCPTCTGIWLDPGELERIRDAISDDRDQTCNSNFASGMMMGMLF